MTDAIAMPPPEKPARKAQTPPAAPEPQMPTIGRIVLVKMYGAHAKRFNGQDEHPAIITRVHDAETINVTLFPDCGAILNLQSIRPVSLDANGVNRQAIGFTWRWPDRV